jgi:rhamnulokinase
MTSTVDFLAADLGASNGRVLLAQWDGARFSLEVLHRFPNGPANVPGRQHWDILGLWHEIKTGLTAYAGRGQGMPAAIGVDTWGVDYGLLDAHGQLLGNPAHYRDVRTVGMLPVIFNRVPQADIFAETGIQFLELNTLIQLYAMRHAGDPQLDMAAHMLMLPDLFNFWLTGRQVAEYTIASTSQMFHAKERRWATGMLAKLGLPTHLLPPVVDPGTVLGPLLPYVRQETGLDESVQVIAVGSHDTASAVAAVPGLDADSVYISSGTWSLMGAEIAQPVINEQVLAYNFTNEGGVGGTIRFLKNIAGMWSLQESRAQWARQGKEYSWGELLALGEEAEPFRSLVNPDAADFHNPSNMLEAIAGYCRAHGQPVPESVGQVVRCCLESLALRYRSVLESIETLTGHTMTTIRVVGGGSQNTLLNQMTADACDRVVVTGPIEATALGNVMVQAIATGHLANLAEGRAAVAASTPQATYEPVDRTGWDDAYGRFLELLA